MVGLSLQSLALLLHARGDTAAAVPLLQRAVSIFETRDGLDHADTMANLAACLDALGRDDEAADLAARVAAIDERMHPEVKGMRDLTDFLRRDGKLQEAKRGGKQGVQVFHRTLENVIVKIMPELAEANAKAVGPPSPTAAAAAAAIAKLDAGAPKPWTPVAPPSRRGLGLLDLPATDDGDLFGGESGSRCEK